MAGRKNCILLATYMYMALRFVFRGSKFVIKMSRDSYNHLKRHLQEKKHHKLLNIIQEHLFIDGKDGDINVPILWWYLF